MELFRYGPAGHERPAVRDDRGATFAAEAVTADYDGTFFATDGIERVAAALQQGSLPPLELGDERIGPPLATPMAIVCIGMNYVAHAAESGSAPPEHPVVFFKHPGTMVGPDDPVVIPRGSQKTDWEVELAAVIKQTPRYLTSTAEALDYVAGYTIVNDVSERAFQIEISGGQWSKGKSAPSFSPVGPILRPAAELDPGNLRLRTWINDSPTQDSSTSDLIFSLPELIVHLSHYMLLMPGDLLLTGTPEGVALSGRFPYLQPGDRIAMEIDGLGRQQQSVVADA